MCVFFMFGHLTADRRRRLAYLFSWYYRHTYMSWYIDMYMIYIRTVLVFLNIDVLRCDAGRLFGFYVAGVAAFVRVK